MGQLCGWAELFPTPEIRRELPHVPRRSWSRKPQLRVSYLPVVLQWFIMIETAFSFIHFLVFHCSKRSCSLTGLAKSYIP